MESKLSITSSLEAYSSPIRRSLKPPLPDQSTFVFQRSSLNPVALLESSYFLHFSPFFHSFFRPLVFRSLKFLSFEKIFALHCHWSLLKQKELKNIGTFYIFGGLFTDLLYLSEDFSKSFSLTPFGGGSPPDLGHNLHLSLCANSYFCLKLTLTPRHHVD